MELQKTTILVTFFIFCGIVLTFIGYFFYRIYMHNKEYQILQFEKLNAEINAAKTERSSIATELHNDIVPLLATVRFRLGSIVSEKQEDIAKCDEALSVSIEEIRRMVRDLAPIEFYDKTFQQAIKDLIQNPMKSGSLVIDFREHEFVEIENDKNEYVYRIVQEIIENAIKHSAAQKLIIEISKEDQHLLIRTSDDGIGFDIEKLSSSGKKGYGLVSIENKVEFLKGSLQIKTGINKGTKYNIRIPV